MFHQHIRSMVQVMVSHTHAQQLALHFPTLNDNARNCLCDGCARLACPSLWASFLASVTTSSRIQTCLTARAAFYMLRARTSPAF